MLSPDDRTILTDALRPPAGMRVDAAVVTTYSLDLTSMLMAPLAMAAHDLLDTGADTDPLALLESVRRYADKTTVYCQAGAIHVPAAYRRIVTFAEDCVVQVVAPGPRGIFHPKVWLLRFSDGDGGEAHRLLVLSRNLTQDRSWDTVLQLDETNEPDAPALDGNDVAEFVEALPAFAPKPPTPNHAKLTRSLTESVRGVRFSLPTGYAHGQFLGFGVDRSAAWPLPDAADRLLVISPFLDATTINRLPEASDRSIVARAESFDRVGARGLESFDTFVLQAPAESEDSDEPSDARERTPEPLLEPTVGLHAKVFVWDEGATSHTLTGSANATQAAFTRNIEASVLLTGKRSACGVNAILDDPSLSLRSVLQAYAPANDGPADVVELAAELDLQAFHIALASADATLTVDGRDDGYYDLAFDVSGDIDLVGDTTVRPVSLPDRIHARSWTGSPLSWEQVEAKDLTPFVAVTTTLVRDGRAVERSCLIKASLRGAPGSRGRTVLRSLLSNQQDLLRLLALLLDDPSLDLGLQVTATDPDSDGSTEFRPVFDDLVLLEPLVRAAARNDDGLGRVARLFDDLADDSGEVPYLTDDIRRLWQTVREAQEVTR